MQVSLAVRCPRRRGGFVQFTEGEIEDEDDHEDEDDVGSGEDRNGASKVFVLGSMEVVVGRVPGA